MEQAVQVAFLLVIHKERNNPISEIGGGFSVIFIYCSNMETSSPITVRAPNSYTLYDVAGTPHPTQRRQLY